jgi:hypothetical protein
MTDTPKLFTGNGPAAKEAAGLVPRNVNLLRKHQSETERLHVVTCISNPNRYEARYRNAEKFIDAMLSTRDVELTVVEACFFGRPAELGNTPFNDPHYHHHAIPFGREGEFFLKEGLINYGVRNLPPGARKFAWVDGDVLFSRQDWAKETLLELDHFDVVQPWTHSIDLGPSGEALSNEHRNAVDRSFAHAYRHPVEGDWRQHYGYAWAMRMDTFEKIGGLIDWLVTGAADYFMALGFANRLVSRAADLKYGKSAIDGAISNGYFERLRDFGTRCQDNIHGNIGVVGGTLSHLWHGPKAKRGYFTRQQILDRNNFDPNRDTTVNRYGIPVLSGNKPQLIQDLREFGRSRCEDSIDV